MLSPPEVDAGAATVAVDAGSEEPPPHAARPRVPKATRAARDSLGAEVMEDGSRTDRASWQKGQAVSLARTCRAHEGHGTRCDGLIEDLRGRSVVPDRTSDPGIPPHLGRREPLPGRPCWSGRMAVGWSDPYGWHAGRCSRRTSASCGC